MGVFRIRSISRTLSKAIRNQNNVSVNKFFFYCKSKKLSAQGTWSLTSCQQTVNILVSFRYLLIPNQNARL